MKVLLLITNAVLVMALSSCQGVRRDFAADIFVGFTYVGMDAQSQLPTAGLQLPETFSAGVPYMFLLPLQSRSLGQWPEFENRLKRAGARITKVPRSGGDLANITSGGPLFRLEFEYNGRRGAVFSEIEPRIRLSDTLSTSWTTERYVLEF
jgi:hypothetical protein